MSSNENPINAPLPHHNQLGAAPRVKLSGGPFVDQTTLARLAGWQKRGISYGQLIDRLVILAVESGYDPVKRKYHKVTKSKSPGTE